MKHAEEKSILWDDTHESIFNNWNIFCDDPDEDYWKLVQQNKTYYEVRVRQECEGAELSYTVWKYRGIPVDEYKDGHALETGILKHTDSLCNEMFYSTDPAFRKEAYPHRKNRI